MELDGENEVIGTANLLSSLAAALLRALAIDLSRSLKRHLSHNFSPLEAL
ncbi:hypothetical protein ASAC_0431 [Acidilobus saccharovorans 345-15]|uniref:Uncharacterized protein n=1 Tax=Acidilobus saccharovorans (strain DSM 16705 / JCM 18335 / VKM B-2471 / 345-15) TaxID=666510 RepID=D9Q0K0_ACIS3|nr:hypothetical protein ASAC_0431 [Acidilobus saccharovorans 345-15]